MRVLEAFETSQKLIDEGRTCEIEFGGKVICKVQLRPADAMLNPEYRRVIAEMSVGIKSNGSGQDLLDQLEDRERLYSLYCRAVISGWTWTDPEDRKATSLRFKAGGDPEINEKNAIALFTKAPKFFEAIQVAARQWGHFRATHEKDVTGN